MHGLYDEHFSSHCMAIIYIIRLGTMFLANILRTTKFLTAPSNRNSVFVTFLSIRGNCGAETFTVASQITGARVLHTSNGSKSYEYIPLAELI
jgi:hypothetical protein